MSDIKTGTSQIADQANPLTIPDAEFGTWTHNSGQKAIAVQVFDSTNGAAIPAADVVVTQPDANTIVLTNGSGGALSVVAIATWEIPTPEATGIVPASAIPVQGS